MKTYREESVTVIDKTVCDCCENEISNPKAYVVSEIEIRHRHDSSYPDGGVGEELDLDICEACLTVKILPPLAMLGVDVRYKEWDF